ncbi:MAG: NUDIX hydrolase [Hyphomonadaceae bacterium]|nr:NUDIX hydrolase [Hyphomonadaceae bacterium]
MSDDNPWRLRGVRAIYDNPWIGLEELDVLNPAGAPHRYGIVRFKKLAVGVLPIDANGDVHLVGQWRVPLGRYSWEMPEGGCEPGEDPAACARRELEEEAGVRAAHIIPILEMDLSNSVTDEAALCFLATGLSPGDAAPEATEVLRNRTAPFLQVLGDVTSGRIRDSLTVAAVLRAYHMAKTGALDPIISKAMLGDHEGDVRT